MCIIVIKKTDQQIDEKIINRCVSYNPDGFGRIRKGDNEPQYSMRGKAAKKWLAEDCEQIVHCRYSTVGKTCKDNCHPFRIADTNIYLFQNGTVGGLEGNDDLSDTACLAQILYYVTYDLKPDEQLQAAYEVLSYFDSRFVLYDIERHVYKTVGDWHEENGVLFSKDNVLKTSTVSVSSWKRYHGDWHEYSQGYKTYKPKQKGKVLTANDTKDIDSAIVDIYEQSKATTPAESRDDYTTDNTLLLENEESIANLTTFNFAPKAGDENILIAVYGTLKSGLHNHHYLKNSTFIDSGYTASNRRMCGEVIPHMLKLQNGDGHRVEVELYTVTYDQLCAVDNLEGHPNWYKREPVLIDCENGQRLFAWVYLSEERYDNGNYLYSFNGSSSDSSYKLSELYLNDVMGE